MQCWRPFARAIAPASPILLSLTLYVNNMTRIINLLYMPDGHIHVIMYIDLTFLANNKTVLSPNSRIMLITSCVITTSGVPRGVLRVLEHPPQLWHNSQFSSSVINIVTDNFDDWKLLPTINLLASKIRSQNSSFSSPFGLKQPSLSASYLQERV